jgi:hypothetical protein
MLQATHRSIGTYPLDLSVACRPWRRVALYLTKYPIGDLLLDSSRWDSFVLRHHRAPCIGAPSRTSTEQRNGQKSTKCHYDPFATSMKAGSLILPIANSPQRSRDDRRTAGEGPIRLHRIEKLTTRWNQCLLAEGLLKTFTTPAFQQRVNNHWIIMAEEMTSGDRTIVTCGSASERRGRTWSNGQTQEMFISCF